MTPDVLTGRNHLALRHNGKNGGTSLYRLKKRVPGLFLLIDAAAAPAKTELSSITSFPSRLFRQILTRDYVAPNRLTALTKWKYLLR